MQVHRRLRGLTAAPRILCAQGDVLDSAKQVLANTIGRVEALLQEGGPKRTLLLVAALFLLLLFLYYYVL
jgi:hypothetical protein